MYVFSLQRHCHNILHRIVYLKVTRVLIRLLFNIIYNKE